MPRTESTIAGRDVTHSQEVSTGLLTQKADGTNSTPTWSADEDAQYGAVQVWMVKHVAAADQAYDSAAAIVNIGGSKPSRNTKFRIIKVETVLRSLRTGGTPDHDWKLEKGDGAASEAFSSAVATIDFDGDTDETPVVRLPVVAQTLIASGETLRSQMAVSGSTTTGSSELDVLVYVIPVVA